MNNNSTLSYLIKNKAYHHLKTNKFMLYKKQKIVYNCKMHGLKQKKELYIKLFYYNPLLKSSPPLTYNKYMTNLQSNL